MTTLVNITNASRPDEAGSHCIFVSEKSNPVARQVLKPGETRTMHVWGQHALVIEEVPIQGITPLTAKTLTPTDD